MEGQAELSDIQRFYRNSTVFLTGTTGFIGKLILEKVLRALPVKKVFILVRSKRNESVEDRVKKTLDSPVFDRIKRNDPNVFDKIAIMEGDCNLPLLGLSDKDISTFKEEVNVIIHSAATTKFDEHIRKATMTNVRGTKDLLDLAKQTKQMKIFIYIGTAYSNSNNSEIREAIYPSVITAENLISVCENLDDDSLTALTPTLTKDWPNTYTFTKQVTEDYIDRQGKSIPVCICRPAIVISTSEEPVTAFVDNMFTLAGFLLAYGLGFTKIAYDKNITVDIIPADYVVNECIAAGWLTGENFSNKKSEVPIYNITTSLDNPITQDQLYGICDHYGREVPTPKIMSYPMYFRTSCRYNYLFLRFFMHTLVAWFMDLPLRFAGKEPKYMVGVQKLHNFQEAYEHFTTNQFFIHVENTHKLLKKMSFIDRSLFNFDVNTLSWDNYFSQYTRGLRFYLLEEKIDTLTDGISHYNSLRRKTIIGGIIGIVVLYVLGKILLFRIIPAALSLLAYFLGKVVC